MKARTWAPIVRPEPVLPARTAPINHRVTLAMPQRTQVQHRLVSLFRSRPAAASAVRGAADVFYRLALLPFRRRRVTGAPLEPPAIVERTDEFNRQAEHYYTSFPDQAFLRRKPFSDTERLPAHLIDTGVLIRGLRLRPGDLVLELGAGTCWLSHLLNKYGCRTIAMDVSPSALAIGRTVFEADPATDWSLDPQFLTYDGHRLPLGDESCDRVVINDAFHHLPNQREILRELHRVLAPDGMAGMSEPGRGHAESEHTRREQEAGVLERELVLEDIAALAMACGFHAVNVLVASPAVTLEVPAAALADFMGGKGFTGYWKALCTSLERHHYIVCHKGTGAVTTARPGQLSAHIDVAGEPELHCPAGEPARLRLRVTNTGDTRWLSTEGRPGWTRIGAHLTNANSGAVLDYDWHRSPLPDDVPPGTRLDIELALPAIRQPGTYVVVIDLVVEGLTWFADRGSHPARVAIAVT